MVSPLLCRFAMAGALGTAVALAIAPKDLSAQQEGGQTPCNAWQVDYALAANLTLTDTPHGAGNGTYRIGPGRAVLQFDNQGGQPGGNVQMLAYEMRENFRIDSTTLFWKTHVVTDSKTTVAKDACGVVTKGAVSGRTVRWSTPVTGYRTDGTLTCDGSLCGSFGAPPEGTSQLHVAPHNVQLNPFQFAPDMKTFTMANTFVSKTQQPQQTAYITLSGREMRRACVVVKSCP